VLEEPFDFTKSLKGEEAVYTLVLSNVEKLTPNMPYSREKLTSYYRKVASTTVKVKRIITKEAAISLPLELKQYKDVFLEAKVDELPTFEHAQHLINTNSEPPFGPLYNLS
jgi:hypothetical protein